MTQNIRGTYWSRFKSPGSIYNREMWKFGELEYDKRKNYGKVGFAVNDQTKCYCHMYSSANRK